MRKGKLLMVFLLPLFLTGCWDKKDPEDRAYIMTMGVDGAENGCYFSFAPANTGDGEAKTYTAESDTLAGAVAQVDAQMSRKTELGQLKTVILSGDILQDTPQLESLLQELERSRDISEKVMLLAAEDSAADCVEAVLKADSKTGLFLWDFYKNTAKEVAVTKGIDLNTFLTERKENGGNGVLPHISLEEEELKLGGGMAVAQDAVYPLSDEEERGYLFLLGEAEGALLEGEYHGEAVPMEIGKSRVKYDFQEKDGSLICTIRLPLEGTLQGGSGQLLSSEQREELEEVFAVILKEEIRHTLEIGKQAGKDLFGILPRLYQQEPSLREHSDDLWQVLQIEVSPELKIKDMGRKR